MPFDYTWRCWDFACLQHAAYSTGRTLTGHLVAVAASAVPESWPIFDGTAAVVEFAAVAAFAIETDAGGVASDLAEVLVAANVAPADHKLVGLLNFVACYWQSNCGMHCYHQHRQHRHSVPMPLDLVHQVEQMTHVCQCHWR